MQQVKMIRLLERGCGFLYWLLFILAVNFIYWNTVLSDVFWVGFFLPGLKEVTYSMYVKGDVGEHVSNKFLLNIMDSLRRVIYYRGGNNYM
jgi:hypothetical protein